MPVCSRCLLATRLLLQLLCVRLALATLLHRHISQGLVQSV